MTPRTSFILAALGLLAIFTKSLYIHPPEHPNMETAIGLWAGIFLMASAWRQAGGRFVVARRAQLRRPR